METSQLYPYMPKPDSDLRYTSGQYEHMEKRHELLEEEVQATLKTSIALNFDLQEAWIFFPVSASILEHLTMFNIDV